jgi:hypothetical protein
MNTQSNLADTIMQTINSNIEKVVDRSIEIKAAREAAEKAYNTTKDMNGAKRSAISQAITQLNDQLSKLLDDQNKAAKTAYDKELISLGLKSEDHPFVAVQEKADEAITVTLNTTGKVARSIFDIAKGLGSKVADGFKS